MASEVDICNLALARLGDNATVASISVNSIVSSRVTLLVRSATLASWCTDRHSFTLKCTSGISSTAIEMGSRSRSCRRRR